MKILRGALLSNLILTHFILDVGLRWPAKRMGTPFDKDESGDRVYGKAVKSLMATYYLQCRNNGLFDMCAWLAEALGPLIDISETAFFDL